MEEMLEYIDKFKKSNKNLERKIMELTIINTNLEILVEAMEYRIQEL